MGNTEAQLALKFVLPVVIRMIANGKDEQETVEAAKDIIADFNKGGINFENKLLFADKEQTKSIIDGLFGLITGIPKALDGIIHALFGLFGGKK